MKFAVMAVAGNRLLPSAIKAVLMETFTKKNQ
jgi:hypothetical protein